MLKNKVIISVKDGNIVSIHASSDMDVVIVSDIYMGRFEPDGIFEVGKGHELFEGKERKFIKKLGI